MQIIFIKKKKMKNEILDIQFIIISSDKKLSTVRENIN